MRLFELIVPDAVLLSLSARTKEEVLEELTKALHKAGRVLHVEKVLAALNARERRLTTGIGRGVSIPHVCIRDVHQPMIAFGRSEIGIEFESHDKKPVHFVFLLLNPEKGASLYVKILARLSHLLNLPGFVEGLNGLESRDLFIEYIKKREEEFGEIEEPEDLPSICVVGAGNGGLAMAAHLSLLGCRVNLFNRGEEALAAVRAAGGIQVNGEVEGFAKLKVVTSSIEEGVSGVDIVMVVVPANGHRRIAELLGPYLDDGQIVILNPGRTGGALEFSEVFFQTGVKTYPLIAEAQTLLYVSRITNPAQVRIFEIKQSVPLATIPAYHIPAVLDVVKRILPQFVPGDNVLKTSLDNIGSVFHPALTILNGAWIEERHGDFEYYLEGGSRSISKILEVLDEERVKVAESLGIRAMTAREWLYLAYGAVGDDLYDAMQANPGYRGIKAPNRLDHRYITEDVPMSLVPIASIADLLRVEVPTIKAFIHLACVLHGRDYWSEGRTVERLGIAGLSVQEIRRLVVEGRRG